MLLDFPKTLVEFDERFGTEAACREYLVRLRWPKGFQCPRCGHDRGWTNRRHDIQCTRCGRQTSLTAGTIFAGTRKPLRVWFRAMWWVSTQKTGGSATGLMRLLGLKSYQTAWTWLQKLRRAMVRPGRDRLVGTVEVDSFVGAVEAGVSGRASQAKARIVVAVEVDRMKIGRVRLRHVPEFLAGSLVTFVGDNVESRQRGPHRRLARLRAVARPGVSPPRHGDRERSRAGLAAAARRAPGRVPAEALLVGTHHGRVEAKHLQAYLDEFAFRFNRRKSRHVGMIFFRLAQQGTQTVPVSCRGVKFQVRLVLDARL